MKDHVINCTLSDIILQINNVIWTPPTTKTNGYTIKNGILDPKTHSQVSTLQISVVKLFELKGFAESHIFGCKIAVGSNNMTFAAKQSISILNPSRKRVFELVGDKCNHHQYIKKLQQFNHSAPLLNIAILRTKRIS